MSEAISPDPQDLSKAKHKRTLHRLSAEAFRDDKGKPLKPAALSLYLWLAEAGPRGAMPRPKVIEELMGITTSGLWKAKQELIKNNLVTFTMAGEVGGYQLSLPRVPKGRQATLDAFLTRARDPHPELAGVTPEAPAMPDDGPAKAPAKAEAGEVSTPAPANPAVMAEAPEKPKARKGVMTTEQMGFFLASANNLELYLRFGTRAAFKTLAECHAEGFPKMGTDWLAAEDANTRHAPYRPEWTIPQFMGYYWDGAMRVREARRIALALPIWGRLSGDISNLLKTTTPVEVFAHIWRVLNHWDLITWRIGGRIGESLVPDEGTLFHKSIREQTAQFSSHGDQWLQAEYARMNTAHAQKEGQIHV